MHSRVGMHRRVGRPRRPTASRTFETIAQIGAAPTLDWTTQWQGSNTFGGFTIRHSNSSTCKNLGSLGSSLGTIQRHKKSNNLRQKFARDWQLKHRHLSGAHAFVNSKADAIQE